MYYNDKLTMGALYEAINEAKRISPLPIVPKRLFESEWLVIPEKQTVERTWKERLFSLPWRPLETIKTVVIDKPNPDVILMDNGDAFCHPTIAARLREAMDAAERSVIEGTYSARSGEAD